MAEIPRKPSFPSHIISKFITRIEREVEEDVIPVSTGIYTEEKLIEKLQAIPKPAIQDYDDKIFYEIVEGAHLSKEQCPGCGEEFSNKVKPIMCHFCGGWSCAECICHRKRLHPLDNNQNGQRYETCHDCDQKFLSLQLHHPYVENKVLIQEAIMKVSRDLEIVEEEVDNKRLKINEVLAEPKRKLGIRHSILRKEQSDLNKSIKALEEEISEQNSLVSSLQQKKKEAEEKAINFKKQQMKKEAEREQREIRQQREKKEKKKREAREKKQREAKERQQQKRIEESLENQVKQQGEGEQQLANRNLKFQYKFRNLQQLEQEKEEKEQGQEQGQEQGENNERNVDSFKKHEELQDCLRTQQEQQKQEQEQQQQQQQQQQEGQGGQKQGQQQEEVEEREATEHSQSEQEKHQKREQVAFTAKQNDSTLEAYTEEDRPNEHTISFMANYFTDSEIPEKKEQDEGMIEAAKQQLLKEAIMRQKEWEGLEDETVYVDPKGKCKCSTF